MVDIHHSGGGGGSGAMGVCSDLSPVFVNVHTEANTSRLRDLGV